MTPMNMIHKETLDTIMMKNSDRLSDSYAFLSSLVEKMKRHPSQDLDPDEHIGRPTESIIIENGVKYWVTSSSGH